MVSTAFLLVLFHTPIFVNSQDDNIFDVDNGDQHISLEEALLADLVPDDDDPSSCLFEDDDSAADTAKSTSWTFKFPGSNPNSNWYEGPCFDQSTYPGAPCHNFSLYEVQLFLAEMSHNDPANSHRNWTMRIGQGSNIYSFYSPELYGEAMPPQYHGNAPWIDEVQQSVSVSSQNNPKAGRPYFIHQAGAYQKDPEYTGSSQVAGDPFFSPNVAKYCKGNTCTFASWGQQAHLPTEFASKLLYVNRYRNCGDGIVEITQTFQNFARSDSVIDRPGYDESLIYFNVPWGGVRTSHLPDVVEPDVAGNLKIDPSDGDVRTPIYGWGQIGPRSLLNIQSTGGYTTFASGVWPNTSAVFLDLPCLKPDAGMVDSCTDFQIANQNYTRMQLQVPDDGTKCKRHGGSSPESLLLACQFRPTGFGRNSGGGKMGPYQFVNPEIEGAKLIFRDIRHWSWGVNDHYTFFSTFYNDTDAGLQQAREDISAAFPPGSAIEASTYPLPMPDNYNPEILPSLTILYGTGEEYKAGGTVFGGGRRRLGSGGGMPRDYTVFTINHHMTRLRPGQTYLARQYMISDELGNVNEVTNALVDETYMAQIDDVDYNGRSVQLYSSADNDDLQIFGAAASTTVGGTTTSCDQGATACTGRTTPGLNLSPFFYISGCGNRTYFGPDLYYYMPGRNHSQDIVDHNGTIRAYACEGQPPYVRPSFRLIGYFNPSDESCTSLQRYQYSPSYCNRRGVGIEGERGTAPATSDATGDQPSEEEQGPPHEDDFFEMDLPDPDARDVAEDISGESASPQPPDLLDATTSASSTVNSGVLQTILAVHQLVRLVGHRLHM